MRAGVVLHGREGACSVLRPSPGRAEGDAPDGTEGTTVGTTLYIMVCYVIITPFDTVII